MKSKKRKKQNYITKADLEAKQENETWEQYFKSKQALKKFANRNKANQKPKDYSDI